MAADALPESNIRLGPVNLDFPGLGTVINVDTVIVGAVVGMAADGHPASSSRAWIADAA